MPDRDMERIESLYELRRYADAERALGVRLAADPDDFGAQLLLVLVLNAQDRYADSLVLLDRLLATQPDLDFVHEKRSDALLGLGRFDEAVAAAREAVRLAPSDWSTHYTLACALRAGPQPRFREALESVNQAVHLAPHDARTHNVAGLCLDDLGMPAEAMRAYREALRLDPHSATVLNNIAALELGRGKLKKASRLITAGLNVNAHERTLHHNYDAILYRLIQRLFWIELGFGAVLGLLAAFDAPVYIRAMTGVSMVAVFVLMTRSVLAHFPRGANRYALGIFRRSPGVAKFIVAVFVVTTVAVLAIAVTPADLAAGIALALLTIFRYTAALVIGIWFGIWMLKRFLPKRYALLNSDDPQQRGGRGSGHDDQHEWRSPDSQ